MDSKQEKITTIRKVQRFTYWLIFGYMNISWTSCIKTACSMFPLKFKIKLKIQTWKHQNYIRYEHIYRYILWLGEIIHTSHNPYDHGRVSPNSFSFICKWLFMIFHIALVKKPFIHNILYKEKNIYHPSNLNRIGVIFGLGGYISMSTWALIFTNYQVISPYPCFYASGNTFFCRSHSRNL